MYAPRPPGPYLGTDVVQHGYAAIARLAGQPEVEVGVVYEDQHVGAPGFEEAVQAAQGPPDEGQVPDDLGESHDRKPFDMVDQLATGRRHAVSADPEYFDSRPPRLERGHDARAMHLARRFTGDDHDPQWLCLL